MATTRQATKSDERSFPLSKDLCWLLSRASFVLTTEMTATLQDIGISPRSHEILVTAMGGEHTQGDLVRMVGIDKTTMVVALDALEAAGLVRRRPSATDRRARVVTVTDAGRRKAQEANEILAGVRADVLSVLPAAERKAFVETLAKLVSTRLSEPAATAQPVRRRAPKASLQDTP
jgi:MarR family transcriptional regulator for hemolysin